MNSAIFEKFFDKKNMAIDRESKKWLTNLFGKDVKFEEPMSKHTSLRVGGPAEAFVKPRSVQSLKDLINWLWQKQLPYLIIGDGTNLLVKDRGIDGMVIALTRCLKTIAQRKIENKEVVVTAMAGARLQTLCSFAIDHGLEGMNFAIGIPGTVGGGIMMNAGTSRGTMERVVESINLLLPEGQTLRIKREKLDFSYRKLTWGEGRNDILQGQPLVLDGCFRLHSSHPEKLKKEAQAILKTRREKHPNGKPSAGCFFKNPASGKTAGELIELAGLKGKSIGGAEISQKHGNFIINRHKAKASDFLALMELVEETISKMFNIDLEREVKTVGT